MTKTLLMAAHVESDAWPSETVRKLVLVPVHRDKFPAWIAGDHVQLQHDSGMRRDYSLHGDTADLSRYVISVQREPSGRGGSIVFHDELAVGDMVFVSYPQTGMRINDVAGHHVFLAGGIGVTAILGIIGGLPPDASAEIHYSVRSRARAPYLEELIMAGHPVSVHDSSSGNRLDVPALIRSLQPDATVYFCGPVPFMDAVTDATGDWEESRVRFENFAPAPRIGAEQGAPFDAWLVLSKRVIRVEGAESLLQAALREGIPVDYSCEGGVCGSCVVEIVEGEIDHQDTCLSAEERLGVMTSCVSRGIGAISLQL